MDEYQTVEINIRPDQNRHFRFVDKLLIYRMIGE